jgi:hypothetical protein
MSDVSICNMALSMFGNIANVSSISSPTTKEERLCAIWYPTARKQVFERFSPQFAIVNAALVETTNALDDTWRYAYTKPTDFVRMVGIYRENLHDGPGEEYSLEGDVIYTQVQSANIKYGKDVSDTAKFTPHLELAIAAKLAAMIVGPLTADTARYPQMEQVFEMYLTRAMGLDANASRNVRKSPGLKGPDYMADR